MNSFLKSPEESILVAEVIGTRKRESGLVIPHTYHERSPFTKSKTLKDELFKASKFYVYMKLEVPEITITRKACFHV